MVMLGRFLRPIAETDFPLKIGKRTGVFFRGDANLRTLAVRLSQRLGYHASIQIKAGRAFEVISRQAMRLVHV